ncbi:unnamed protein product [Parnassius mnemosyne]|uniref:ALMS motif domain-containing protein n=1 Tax=Parnassius mnemosyne TaxID=213953 RepID=A0AAV1M3B8_9NEOP
MWTWLSPKKRRSQIDYILTNRKENISNIEIISNLTFPSDHRLLRSTLQIAPIKKSRANFKNYKTKLSTLEEREQFIQSLNTNINKIEWEENENIESSYAKIKKPIITSLNLIRQKPTRKRETVPVHMKSLIARRSELIQKKSLTKEEKDERTYLYKNIYKLMKRERTERRIKDIKTHLESTGSLKRS